jgi:hypothetical protein
MKKLIVASLSLTAFALVITGCVTTQQARSTKPAAFLGNATSLLKPGTKGEALEVYFNPDVNWKQYQKVIISPVTYWVGKGEKDGLSAAHREALVNFYHLKLVQEAGKLYTVVDQPEQGTIRYSAALIRAEHSEPVLETISTVYPAALVISAIKEGVVGKASFVGQVSSEVKATDAVSGELLAAAADERVGGMAWHGKFDRWEAVDDSSTHWAQEAVYRLCTLQGRTDCPKPTEK